MLYCKDFRNKTLKMKYLIWVIVISAVIIAGWKLYEKLENSGAFSEANGSPKPENPDGENPSGGENGETPAGDEHFNVFDDFFYDTLT